MIPNYTSPGRSSEAISKGDDMHRCYVHESNTNVDIHLEEHQVWNNQGNPKQQNSYSSKRGQGHPTTVSRKWVHYQDGPYGWQIRAPVV